MSKVAVVSCGAMGSVYAGLMQLAGHEVQGVCLWPGHVDAVNARGLRVTGASGDHTVRLASMATTTDGIGVCDLVIIASLPRRSTWKPPRPRAGITCATQLTIGEVMSNPTPGRSRKPAPGRPSPSRRPPESSSTSATPSSTSVHSAEKSNARPSMLLDFNLRRRGEVDAILGQVAVLGERYSVATPVTRTLADIIRARESSYL